MNIISVLTTDHRNVDELFTRFEKADPADTEELGRLRAMISEQLSIHATIEEQTLYPALRAVAADTSDADVRDAVLEALEEHHAVKAVLAELERMKPGAERFRAKMQVVIDSVRHHVEEEEGDDGVFALARTHLDQPAMEKMAEQAEKLRAGGPNRPHPLSPDQPPLNLVLGVPMAVLDRTVTTARRAIEAVVHRRAS